MAIKTINTLLGITENNKKIEKDLKIYFNKKSHRIIFRFNPEFKSNECEFLFDDENNKLIIIEARKNSNDSRKLSKDKYNNFIVSYKKLFNIPSIPTTGSLIVNKETIGVPGVSGKKIIKIKSYTIDLNNTNKLDNEEVLFETNNISL